MESDFCASISSEDCNEIRISSVSSFPFTAASSHHLHADIVPFPVLPPCFPGVHGNDFYTIPHRRMKIKHYFTFS